MKLVVPFFFVLWHIFLAGADKPAIHCRDPDLGGTVQNRDRKFVVMGAENTGGAGIGNLLIFYPAAFYFAAITGRDIMITDHSALGGMCNIIHCGFPYISQMKLAFPDIVNDETLNEALTLKSPDFIKYVEGHLPVDRAIVRAGGFLSKSDWWVWFNSTAHCVAKITGCDLGDVMCAERHAYQRLVRGPFKAAFTEKEEQRISGVPNAFKHSLLTLPHSYAPRLDIAVHLRTQFHHFEQQADINDPNYKKEVSDWLNSDECAEVFRAVEERVALIVQVRTGELTKQTKLKVEDRHVYVYLASDNQEVKEALQKYLQQKILARSSSYTNQTVLYLQVNANSIVHVKDYNRFKHATNNEGMLDLVFDWYALSLSNTLLAWRKGGSNILSTFVHSAQKVSGTIERTDNIGGAGVGTRGYQLTRDKRGNLKFDVFWGYIFIEDYAKP
jgi:hypothetical protein